MKAITVEKQFPKLLKISERAVNNTRNRYLLNPWKKGEIVRVAPFGEQHSKIGEDDATFRRNYVVIERKIDGVWNRCVWSWKELELLKS